MPLLNEYLKLRAEQTRELTWGELDENFLYVANPWSPERNYREGNIVYHDAGTSSGSGLSWWVAAADNGPETSFNIGNWSPIGASSSPSGSVIVQSGFISNTISVLDLNTSDFNVSFVGSTATISVNGGTQKYWLEAGDPDIGTGQNATPAIHTGNIVIGSGSFPSAYKLAVYGTTNITGNLTVGGTINTVDILALANDYSTHTHTAVPITYPSYGALYPNSISALEDFNINSGTLAQGDTLIWNNSTKKWINSSSSVGTLSGLSDVNITAAVNNQVLRYNSSLSKWENVTVVTDNSTGFSTAPFSHNHNTVYYTKSQLNTSGGSSVHWNNLTSKPTDTTQYVIVGAPGAAFTLPNYRVLTSSDGSIGIDVTNANIIDLTTAGAGGTIGLSAESLFVATASDLNFVSTDSGKISTAITAITGGTEVELQIDALHGYEIDVPGVLSWRTTSRLLNPVSPFPGSVVSNVEFTVNDNPGDDVTEISAISRSPIIVNASWLDPRYSLTFTDSATITWSITDDPGNDTHVITATGSGTSGGGTYTVDNGLNENPVDNFRLGGPLVETTNIDATGYDFSVTTANVLFNISDTSNTIQLGEGASDGFLYAGSAAAALSSLVGFGVDKAAGQIIAGDIASTAMRINTATGAYNVGVIYNAVPNSRFIDIDPGNGTFRVGDGSGSQNATVIQIDDINSSITAEGSGIIGAEFNFASNTYKFGNSTDQYLYVDATTGISNLSGILNATSDQPLLIADFANNIVTLGDYQGSGTLYSVIDNSGTNEFIFYNGPIRAASYGGGSITGTATYYLAVDATGKIVEEASNPAGGTSGSAGTSGDSTGSSGTAGTRGTSGSSGTRGTSGTTGSSGTRGTSGTSGGGTAGTTGTSGTSGIGTAGTSGTSAVGTSGTSGTKGTSGTTGTSGANGTSGTKGTSGTSGKASVAYLSAATTTSISGVAAVFTTVPGGGGGAVAAATAWMEVGMSIFLENWGYAIITAASPGISATVTLESPNTSWLEPGVGFGASVALGSKALPGAYVGYSGTAGTSGATTGIAFRKNNVAAGSFPTLNINNPTGGITNTFSTSGTVLSVSQDLSATLQDICDNGFATLTNLRINTAGGGLILTAPNSTKWLITVDNTGALITTATV